MKLEVVQFLDFQEGRSPSVSQQGGLPQVKQGAPVHIAWRTFYSGDLPDRNFKKRKNKTAVLSSFVKLSADSNAAPRVVSAVFEDPDDHHDFTPSAKGAGSPVILYQSTAQGETLVEVELMSKRRGSEDLDNLSEALQKAGNSPLLFFANGNPC